MTVQSPVETLREAQAAATKDVEEAVEALKDALDRYEAAVLAADDLGVGATALSRVVGQTEAGVRAFIARRRAGVPRKGLG